MIIDCSYLRWKGLKCGYCSNDNIVYCRLMSVNHLILLTFGAIWPLYYVVTGFASLPPPPHLFPPLSSRWLHRRSPFSSPCGLFTLSLFSTYRSPLPSLRLSHLFSPFSSLCLFPPLSPFSLAPPLSPLPSRTLSSPSLCFPPPILCLCLSLSLFSPSHYLTSWILFMNIFN